jgi:hypothetical protein
MTPTTPTSGTSRSSVTPMDIRFLEEPLLEFRYGQSLVDPRSGLALFGPYDSDQPSHPEGISYGLIGTAHGNTLFADFAQAFQGPIRSKSTASPLWPMFPGFEAVFATKFQGTAARTLEIQDAELDEATRLADPKQRAWRTVDLYLNRIQQITGGDDRFGLILCIVPDYVWQRCRPLSVVARSERVGARPSRHRVSQIRAGQQPLFEDDIIADAYAYSPDFRRQLKARCMHFGIPLQIIRESALTLAESGSTHRDLTPLSDRAWNLGVACYYKAGGKPWRLTSARPGVSYLGLAFRRTDPDSQSSTAACAAQMFLDTGDGIVFLGENGPWYSPETRSYRLSPQGAYELLTGTLETYAQQGGQALREIFLHCRSSIGAEEFEGFRRACPAGVKLVAVRIRPRSTPVRLYRQGKYPVLRGMFWRVSDSTAFLWTTGYKPALETYDGAEVPVPLQIDIQHGDGSIAQVTQDILSLTKLNYNASRLAKAEPVTVGFSDAVGEILVSNPEVKEHRPQFRFYI